MNAMIQPQAASLNAAPSSRSYGQRNFQGEFQAAIISELGTAPMVIVPGRWIEFQTQKGGTGASAYCRFDEDQLSGVFGCRFRATQFEWSASPTLALELPKPSFHKTLGQENRYPTLYARARVLNEATWERCDPVRLPAKAIVSKQPASMSHHF